MDPAEQAAFAERERLPYPLLNDGPLRLRDELGLPTFDVHGTTLYKRLTFVARAGRIEKVFYPVFPPDAQRGRGGELAAARLLEAAAGPSGPASFST